MALSQSLLCLLGNSTDSSKVHVRSGYLQIANDKVTSVSLIHSAQSCQYYYIIYYKYIKDNIKLHLCLLGFDAVQSGTSLASFKLNLWRHVPSKSRHIYCWLHSIIHCRTANAH